MALYLGEKFFLRNGVRYFRGSLYSNQRFMDPDNLPYKTTVGFNPSHQNHINTVVKGHPEAPGRISAVEKKLGDSQLWKDVTVIKKFYPVDDMDLQQTHSEDYVTTIKASQTQTQEELNSLAAGYDSVFLTKDSYQASADGVACVRSLAEYIMEGKIPNAFALVRPPGHHSSQGEANGFCVFNTSAQAAEAAFNFGADRILIVDLDLHHGQGTQRMFYDDKRVLYFSVHRFEQGRYWPHLAESNFDHIGEGEGKGYNVNVPLNETGCGDADYLAALWNVLMPLAIEFDPQFVIISAGFDSCTLDPIGGMELSPDCYAQMIYQLKALAQGKMLLVLEGGYNHEMVAAGAERCLRVLTGRKPYQFEVSEPAKESTISSILSVIGYLKPHWPCFDFYPMRAGEAGVKGQGWDVHNSIVRFDPPTSDERPADTADIHQEQLKKWRDTVDEDPQCCSTMLIWDESSELHYDQSDDTHVENPKRTSRIMARLRESGLTDRCDCLSNERSATEDELKTTHSAAYLKRLRCTEKMSEEELRKEESNFNSIFFTGNSYLSATRAVGAILETVDRVVGSPAGKWNAFAVVRPPGHHAGISTPGGFCLLNNVGVAANYAMSKFGLERILIVDWDVHHGNGTQEIFYEDPRVLYLSLHRHEGGCFFPMGEPKDFADVGKGEGKGRNVNIPWSYARMGDLEYRAAFNKIVMPIATQFNPQLVFISAGFDAATGDPLGEYKVSPSTYSLMTHQLSGLAGGRTIAVLEGGYNLDSISESSLAVLEVLVDNGVKRQLVEPLQHFASRKPRVHPEAWISMRRVAQTQMQYWNCLKGLQVDGDHRHEIPEYSSSSSSESDDGESVRDAEEQTDREDRGTEMADEQPGSSKGIAPSSNIDPSAFEGLHAVVPLAHCPHLEKVAPLPPNGIDHNCVCATCTVGVENWVCLGCYKSHCGRHVHEHALMHSIESEHPMALSMADLSVWCYPCDSYVHNEVLIPAKNSAHQSKFGEEMPGAK